MVSHPPGSSLSFSNELLDERDLDLLLPMGPSLGQGGMERACVIHPSCVKRIFAHTARVYSIVVNMEEGLVAVFLTCAVSW